MCMHEDVYNKDLHVALLQSGFELHPWDLFVKEKKNLPLVPIERFFLLKLTQAGKGWILVWVYKSEKLKSNAIKSHQILGRSWSGLPCSFYLHLTMQTPDAWFADYLVLPRLVRCWSDTAFVYSWRPEWPFVSHLGIMCVWLLVSGLLCNKEAFGSTKWEGPSGR